MDVKQRYNQDTDGLSQLELESVGTRCRSESQRQTEGFGPQWPMVEQPQPRWERSAAMIRRTLGQYVPVCPRLQLTSHTQPTSTLSRIKCERYIFIKKCVRSFIEVRHYCWLCFRVYLYMYMCCIVIYTFMHHNDTTSKTDAWRKTLEDFFNNIFYLSLYCKGSKGLFKVCMWEGAGETEHKLHILSPLLWPSRCVFLVLLMLGSTPSGVFRGPPRSGVAFPTTSGL